MSKIYASITAFVLKPKPFYTFMLKNQKAILYCLFISSSKISIEISKKDENNVFRGIPSHNKHVRVFFGSKVVSVIPLHLSFTFPTHTPPPPSYCHIPNSFKED